MKKVVFLIIFGLFIIGCVQKTYKQTVIYTLKTSHPEEIKTVGIRGNDKPLSWDSDTELIPLKKDSLYQIKITYLTGYKFTEVKFTINGDYELKGMPNRRIDFNPSGTTHYNATFNQASK
ncbi:hypothetical protein QF023_001455 [Chryseobacterium sp. SLBN-27]|uniref:hypothetical protein n=1 Tax=Chryseobacterium sp. SLBN-27 TaxID=3042287 RepID=UPI00285C6276|nr:hypothetical protein [Chryseobacterium sp. SLBN-27]MDR6157939.1 hypothetical protein [Chryseobacterium sp. SLBN-27]